MNFVLRASIMILENFRKVSTILRRLSSSYSVLFFFFFFFFLKKISCLYYTHFHSSRIRFTCFTVCSRSTATKQNLLKGTGHTWLIFRRVTSRKHAYIIYMVKLGFTRVNIIFLFLLKTIDCGYSLEPPRRGGSNEYPQSMF